MPNLKFVSSTAPAVLPRDISLFEYDSNPVQICPAPQVAAVVDAAAPVRSAHASSTILGAGRLDAPAMS